MASPFQPPRSRPWLAASTRGPARLGLLQLEDRVVPSSSIPLSGVGWTPIGGTIIPAIGTTAANPLPATGRVTSVATQAVPFQPSFNGVFDPTDPVYNTVYAGAASGGLARSIDSGRTWQFLTDNLPDSAWLNEQSNRNLQVGAIGVSPLDANFILVGTGEAGFPEVKLTDGLLNGNNFSAARPTPPMDPPLPPNPSPGPLTTRDLGGTGILRSVDGGATFNLVPGPNNAFVRGHFEKFVFHPTDPNIAFAVFYVGPGRSEVYRSVDKGQNWVSVTGNVPSPPPLINVVPRLFNDLIISPDNPSVAFVTLSSGGIYRSANFLNPGLPSGQQPNPVDITYTQVLGGTGTVTPGNTLQWTKMAFGRGTPDRPSRIYAISSSTIKTQTADQLFRSDDSGINFRRLDPAPDVLTYNAAYNLSILPDPTSPSRVFFAGRGARAVQLLANGDFNPDLGQLPNYINLPLPDNSSIRNIRSMQFDDTGAKDANGRAISPGRLIITTDAGMFRFQAVDGRPTLISDYLNPAGNLELVSLNGLPGPTALQVQEFYSTALAPRSDNLVLGGTNGNGTSRFTDGGPGSPFAPGTAAYNSLFYHAPVTGVGTLGTSQDIVFSQIDPNRVYRVSNFPFDSTENEGGLFQYSTDAGQTWTTSINGILFPTVSRLNGTPTDFNISNKTAFIADPSPQIGNPEARLFLGTRVVNQSLDGGRNWAQFGPDLPFVTPQRPGGPSIPSPLAQPRISAIGRSLQSANTFANRIYVAVTDRISTYTGDNFTSGFGPAIYRYDRTPGDPQFWTNVSPDTVSELLQPIMGAPGFPVGNSLQGIVRQLIVDPTDEEIIYAIVGGNDTARVLRSTSGGSQFDTNRNFVPQPWVDITANLPGSTAIGAPGLQVYSIALDPNRLTVTSDPNNPFTQSDDDLYIGTSVGVWKLTDPTNPNSQWSRLAGTGADVTTGTPANAGALPDVAVRDVELNTTTGVLSAGTFGRGMWQFQIRPFFRGQLINDTTGNGVRDAGDSVVDGGVVLAIDNAPTPPNQFANTTSAVNGEYVFRSLPDSNYTFLPADASFALVDPATKFYITAPAINKTVNQLSTLNGQNLFVFDRIDISGVVYVDQNGNGTRDKGEVVAAGYTVTLNTPGGTSVATAVTDAQGRYTIRGVGPRRTPQAVPGAPADPSYIVTVDKAGTQVTQQPMFLGPLVSGVDITSASPAKTQIGVFQLGTVSGSVYEDKNADGVRAPNEQGLAGFVVGLVGPGGQFVANATTDATGAYSFGNLGAGNFQLVFNNQPGFGPTTPSVITIGSQSGTVVDLANFGVYAGSVLSGTAYDDLNGNGLRDPGEPGIAGAPVALFAATATGFVQVMSTAADAAGNYSFAPVFAAVGVSTFAVRLGSAPGLGQSSGDPIVTPLSGTINGGLDIGVARAITVSGVAFEDVNGNGIQDAGEPGLAGGSVALRDTSTGAVLQTASTDAFGNFAFGGVVPPRFSAPLEVTAPTNGFTQTTPRALFTAFSGQPIAGLTIGLFRGATFSGLAALDINGNGFVEDGEPRLAGRVVQLLDAAGNVVATTTTDANGFYQLGSGPGSFRPFFPVAAGSTLTNPPLPLTPTLSGQAVGNQNFAEFVTVTARGRVFNDLNGDGQGSGEPGLAGILVQVFDAGAALVAQARTDAAGNYFIPNLAGNFLRVQVVPPAPFPTPPGVVVNPTSGQDFAVDFPLLTLASVSGRVFRDQDRSGAFSAGDLPAAGRAVQLVQNGNLVASTLSDAAGNYSFGGLAPGAYTVRLAVPAAVSVVGSVTRDVVVTSGAAIGQDFGIVPSRRYALAADGGGGPRVQVYDQLTGGLLQDFFVYETTFTGGVRVATGDVTGDGVDDLIVAAGKGGGPRIRVLDGVTQKVVYDYFAYEPTFRDGLFVTVGDFNGDGFADIATGTEAGGGPRVTVFDGKSAGIVADYFAYDSSFRGGVRVGAGDVTGTGRASVLTAPGVGGGPVVIAWGIAGGAATPQFTFNAFNEGYTGGIYLAAAAAGPGGRSNIVVGSGQLQPDQGVAFPVVRLFDSASLGAISETEAFPGGVEPGGYRSEVRVAAFDRTGDGVADLALASGPNAPPRFRILDGVNRRQVGDELQPYEFAFRGGIFVG